MQSLTEIAPAFVEMAHNIVWCSAATVDKQQRPWSRILHPIWQWDGESLTGWIATGPTPIKRAHLEHSAYISLNYWSPDQNTCVAECETTWLLDDADRRMVWDLFLNTPPPVGYDPAMIPVWEKPTDESFAALKLNPWRLRVYPGTVLLGQGGEVLTWQQSD
jgi:hypothetical protein